MARWFHKNINGVEAEQLLMEKGQNGSFLVRKSQNGEGFAIEVLAGSEVIHIKIQQQEELFTLGFTDPFATLSELIEYHQQCGITDNEGRVIQLKYPLYQEDNIITERWFHEGITGSEAEKILMEKGKDGSFLVRVSQREVDSYVVSSRLGTRVNHVRIVRNPKTNLYDVGGGKEFATVSELVQFYMKTPMVEKTGSLITLGQPLNTTRINLLSLGERIQELQKMNSRYRSGFSEEFEKLQSESHEGAKSRESDINRNKNRYRNILPFDETRVVLHEGLVTSTSISSNTSADPINDYINANYIVAPFKPQYSDLQIHCERKYIATQGPLSNTIVDFWRMVWQEESKIIVMITKFVENKKAKCELYWPNNPGDLVERHALPDGTFLKVELLHEFPSNDYTLREFSLSKEGPGIKVAPRRIHHFHFTAWPDRWTPEDPSLLLNFLHEVDEKQNSHRPEAPMIVHCSAGIGRTGTYIAIDMLVQHIMTCGLQCDIDISRTIQMLRDQRSGMVQTEQQYRFVYKTILGEVETMKQRSQMEQVASRTGHEYTNIYGVPNDSRRVGTGTSPPNQYACHADMVPLPTNSPPWKNPILSTLHTSPPLQTSAYPILHENPVNYAPQRPPRRAAQRIN